MKSLNLLIIVGLLLSAAESTFAQAKLGVARVIAPGWVTPGDGGYTWKLYSDAGYLTSDGDYELRPDLGSTLAENIEDNEDASFLVVDGYYAGFRWADVADMQALFPKFTFIQNPRLEGLGIVSYQQVRVIPLPKSSSASSASSAKYKKTQAQLKNAKQRLKKADSAQEIARIRRQIADLQRKLKKLLQG